MISQRQVKIEVEGLMALKSLVEVYEEVAAGRMQKVRGAVVQSREFLLGLLEVFKKVKLASKLGASRTWRQPNGRTVAVFVSANTGLYGDIVDRTFELFRKYVAENKSDVVVLGKWGLKIMKDKMPGQLYNYYDFSDDEVDMESFSLIMRYLIQFERIVVFYGSFKSIVTQNPVATMISGDATDNNPETKQKISEFLFEPSIEVIGKVFEGEILGSIFEQTLHESQLSKFASRMLALDRAIDNVNLRMKQVKLEGQRTKHRMNNKKMLNGISGLSLWKRRNYA